MIDSFRTLFAPPRHLILIVAALWIGLALAEKRSERHGVPKETLNNLTFYSLLSYIIGGRVLYALVNFPAFAPSPLSLFSPNPDLFDPVASGLSSLLIGYIYGKRQNLSFWNTLDSLTPVFASLAIGLHLSHLAAGTAFGSPTDLPWGIELWNATRHPTQMYELIASLIILGLLWFRKQELSPGLLFLHFIALTAGARLFLEAFHGDSALIFGGFRLAQVAAWVVLAIVLIVKEPLGQKNESG
jgi:prolipoprotein diacylglyceryltransferase